MIREAERSETGSQQAEDRASRWWGSSPSPEAGEPGKAMGVSSRLSPSQKAGEDEVPAPRPPGRKNSVFLSLSVCPGLQRLQGAHGIRDGILLCSVYGSKVRHPETSSQTHRKSHLPKHLGTGASQLDASH